LILPDPLRKTKDLKPSKVLGSDFNETMGQFSPDGQWIAYVSDESGH
jgi:Tol biopolymer transport system component